MKNKKGYRYEVRYRLAGYTDGTRLFAERKDASDFISKLNSSPSLLSYELGHASDDEGHGWEFIYGWSKPNKQQEEQTK